MALQLKCAYANRKLRCGAARVGAFHYAPGGYHRSLRRGHWPSQSAQRQHPSPRHPPRGSSLEKSQSLTARASSRIDWPAMAASSALSLISKLMTCIGRLYSPPRASKSASQRVCHSDVFSKRSQCRAREVEGLMKARGTPESGLTVADSIVASLLACDHHIGSHDLLLLPLLWRSLHSSISVQHGQYPIARVPELQLCLRKFRVPDCDPPPREQR